MIISNAKEKTELIEDKDIKYNIGDKCRIKENTKIFDKMKRKYSAEIYTIIKVNKNTVVMLNLESLALFTVHFLIFSKKIIIIEV